MIDYRKLKLSYTNMDIYFPLKQKVDLIFKLSKSLFVGKLLDVGCGRMPYKNIVLAESKVISYTGIDIENEIYQNNSRPDFFWDGKTLPFDDNSYDTVVLIEVLEHVPDPVLVLGEVCRVTSKEGKVLITVPFLWNLHDVPFDEYRYTPFSLKRICEKAGFKIEELKAFGGWHASIGAHLALFLRRAPMRPSIKKLLSIALLPVIKFLYKKDSNYYDGSFREGQMITGLWCILSK